MEMARPQAEHSFLKRLVGTWRVTAKDMTGDEPWTEEVRSLQDIWFVAEGRGQTPDGGGPATTVLTLGFDPQKGKYVGSWIGSMMTHMWVYEGEISADGNTLSLYTTGPDFQDPAKTGEYREQILFQDDNNRIFTSSARQTDGSWSQFMEAHYTRMS
ncbi:DUF1579 domain-containing protein [Pseudorhizobium tarimense]|nr:DUF1579 domain-containing protein [Pseudorhizobium tarimense]MCJ8517413.1 DUF1579 domain-containing protein [Pseudorhizobium tarimense]